MQPQLVDPPYSFFDLAKEYGDLKPLKRALSVLRRTGVRTMVRTSTELDGASFAKDEDEPEVITDAVGSPVTKVRFDTLSFYNQPYTESEQLPSDGRGLLGQITLKGFFSDTSVIRWIVKKCVLTPEDTTDLYICAFRKHEIALPLYGRGALEAASHCQQTRHTNCCAHAAIRTALECLGSYESPPPTHRQINQSLGVDHSSRKAWQGLQAIEIANVLASAGTRPLVYAFDDNISPKISFEHLIYLGIESGFPVILGFETDNTGHVVTVVGHTFSGNNWLPEATLDYVLEISKSKLGYIPSAAWLDNLVLQDDNYGPYYCLPSAFLRSGKRLVIIVTDLKEDEAFADEAEIHAVGVLPALSTIDWDENISKWTQILLDHISTGKTIARTTLATRSAYLTELKEHRVSIGQSPTDAYAALSSLLPDRFWATEISVPELFTANRAKIGEILVDPRDLTVMLVRLPGLLLVFQNNIDADHPNVLAAKASDIGYLPLRRLSRCMCVPACGTK